MSAVAKRYYDRGLAYAKQAQWADAANEFRAALELAPRMVDARLGLVQSLTQLGDCASAVAVGRVGGERERVTAQAALQATVGDAYLRQGDLEGAAHSYEALASEPRFDARRELGLAVCHAKQGQFRELAAALIRAARSTS